VRDGTPRSASPSLERERQYAAQRSTPVGDEPLPVGVLACSADKSTHSRGALQYARAERSRAGLLRRRAGDFRRLRFAWPVSALARYAIVLALDDVVDLEHFGLTRKLDPNVL
jgi:hypothetical protein